MAGENEQAPAVRRSRAIVWSVSLFVFLVAVILALVPVFASDTRQRISRPLAEIVPVVASGWDVRTLDVADSAELRSRVEQILQYDDVVFRSYRRGMVEVQIYAAYWKPGTVPYGQAGVHTPDTCWVAAGWSLQDAIHGQMLKCGDYVLKQTESRRFSARGQTLYVAFWHLVGDRVHTYEQFGWRNGLTGFRERLPNLLSDLRRYGFNLAQEQLFVRVSANMDLDALFKDPAFASLMVQLRPLGIFADPTGSTVRP